MIGDAVAKYLADNKDVSILDVAAGSGVCGLEVSNESLITVLFIEQEISRSNKTSWHPLHKK